MPYIYIDIIYVAAAVVLYFFYTPIAGVYCCVCIIPYILGTSLPSVQVGASTGVTRQEGVCTYHSQGNTLEAHQFPGKIMQQAGLLSLRAFSS